MKHFYALLLIVVLFVSGCQPSDTAIQTALAQTQAANPTSTFTPIPPTETPTPTVNSCTDRGWADIVIYLKQFDQLAPGTAGTSVSAHLNQLENIKNLINQVSIDACTEHARQLFVGSEDNWIYLMKLLVTNTSDSETINTLTVEIATMRINAITELEGLGIHLNYP